MPEALRRALLTAWLALLAVGAQALTLVDDRGVTVELPRAPQRIVSLFPSLTETVCVLGACERLVGLDRYSNFPVSVRALPRVGGGLDPSIEAIVALRPDVVLMATSTRGAERLTSLGVHVVALQPGSHADVRRMLERVAVLLGVPASQAQRVWGEIEAELDQAASAVPMPARGRRVYFEVGSGPYAAGAASFIGETLTRLGTGNIVPASLGPYPRLNPEFVVHADPDLIMIGEGRLNDLARRPGWAGLRAVRAGRICTYTPQESDILVRAGPRLAEAARLMLRCLQSKGGRP